MPVRDSRFAIEPRPAPMHAVVPARLLQRHLAAAIGFCVGKEPGADSLARFNRTRAITIEANLAPGYALGEAIEFMESAARELLPPRAVAAARLGPLLVTVNI